MDASNYSPQKITLEDPFIFIFCPNTEKFRQIENEVIENKRCKGVEEKVGLINNKGAEMKRTISRTILGLLEQQRQDILEMRVNPRLYLSIQIRIVLH